jgi:anti-anti-sigma factor
MAVHALTEVGLAPGRAREVLWAAARLARRLGEQPGFRWLRVFRSEADADSLIVLTEWTEWEAAVAAEAATPVAELLSQLRAACARWDSRLLDSLFHLQLPRHQPCAGIAQALHVSAHDADDGPARQKEFGLRAMTLPGTVGVMGGRCSRDPRFLFCAVEFDSDESMLDFAGSATRRDWSRLGATSWWQKEARFERNGIDSKAEHLSNVHTTGAEMQAEVCGSLSVRVESSPDGAAVVLRLSGSLDEAAAERFVQVRDAVVAHGCRHLTLDVSELTGASSLGLQTLLATARRVKAAGGRFTLVDNQGRFNRTLRVLQLNQALPGEGGEARRRRPATLRLNPRWTT